MNKNMLLCAFLAFGLFTVAAEETAPAVVEAVALKTRIANVFRSAWTSTKSAGSSVKNVAGTIATDTWTFAKARGTNVKNAAVWSKDKVVNTVKSSANFVSTKAVASKDWTVNTAKTHPYYTAAAVAATVAAVYYAAPQVKKAYNNWKNSAVEEEDELTFEA